MAHATVEWTDNLDGTFDRAGLLALIAQDMRERAGGVFPVGGIRVRAIRLTEYVIADGQGPDDAFINIDVKMGAGRSAEFRKAYFDALFERVSHYLEPVFAARPLALSLYVEEAEGWKRNTIHKRLGKPS
ncbi:MAG: 5-carboxymethyl-2-hydroxymuconate isomerase [Novosphingobium sp.]|nr:5-carboxymethyl-2-hydroxymuconate isomerase [Novosphingobium sp.]